MENPTAEPPANIEAPPAATVVTQSPREIELETELANERAARIEAERVAAENEDRLRQVVDADSRRPNNPPVAKPKKKIKVPGNTFFHPEEEIEEED